MEPAPKPRDQKEAKIQKAIVKMLEQKGWYVKVMHASASLDGVPDLYIAHPINGPRWVEVKLPYMKGSKFTNAQKREFPKLLAANAGIWILTAANEENYRRLFKPQNCGDAMRTKALGGTPNV